jgi:hypothetical protein
MWNWIRFICSTIALIAFAIRLAEEKERKDLNPVLVAALAELIAYEGIQVRARVTDLLDVEGNKSWLRT